MGEMEQEKEHDRLTNITKKELAAISFHLGVAVGKAYRLYYGAIRPSTTNALFPILAAPLKKSVNHMNAAHNIVCNLSNILSEDTEGEIQNE